MGSGKGKARRTQTPAAEDKARFAKPTLDMGKWSQFVKDLGVGNVNLQNYYLGHEARYASKDFLSRDYEKIISGLFADAVISGALVLPTGQAVGDYEFIVEDKFYPGEVMVVKRNGEVVLRDFHFDCEQLLGRDLQVKYTVPTMNKVRYALSIISSTV